MIKDGGFQQGDTITAHFKGQSKNVSIIPPVHFIPRRRCGERGQVCETKT